MAEPVEVNDVLHVTGLTPSIPAVPEPEPSAAPIPEGEEAKPAGEPAAAESAPEADPSTAQTPDAHEGAVAAGEATQEGEPAKKPARGVQKALDRLTREREEANLRAAQAIGAFQALQAQIQAGRQPEQAKPTQAVPTEQAPERKDFADWEAFNRATAQWEARQASTQVVRQELGNFVRALVGQQVHQTAQAEAAAKVERVAQANVKARERFPDWDEKVLASEAIIPPSLYDAIAESSDPALVMHHLGVHPEEHAKLSKMTAKQQLMAVGQIVASANSSPPRVSNAPAPARPVAAVRGAQGGSQYTDNMTPEQHKAYMRKQGLDRGLK
jgi:hypothetical protein